MDGGTLGYDSTITDGTASLAQRISKDSKEDNRCDDALEGEEVLDLGVVRIWDRAETGCEDIPWYKECTGMEAAGGSKAESRSSLRW